MFDEVEEVVVEDVVGAFEPVGGWGVDVEDFAGHADGLGALSGEEDGVLVFEGVGMLGFGVVGEFGGDGVGVHGGSRCEARMGARWCVVVGRFLILEVAGRNGRGLVNEVWAGWWWGGNGFPPARE